MMEEYTVTVETAAEELGLSEASLRMYMWGNGIKVKLAGKMRLMKRSDVENIKNTLK